MSAEMKTSEWPESRKPLGINEALAKAQLDMQNPTFDSTNPHFRNKFASLAAVRNAVVPVLAKHGIAMVQDVTSTEDGKVACKTILHHKSGESLTFGPLVLPVSKNDAQGFGSAATYARRYSLMAVAGVVGDDDDDANAATGKPGAAEKDEDMARAHALSMLAIIAAPAPTGDHDGLKKCLDALDYHEKHFVGHGELYQAVYRHMDAPNRKAWKDMVDAAKAAEKANKAR